MDLGALARRLSQPQPAPIAWQAWATAARERRAIAVLWPFFIPVWSRHTRRAGGLRWCWYAGQFPPLYSAASETDKDIAKKDLVGYGVSLMGGVEAPARGSPPPLTTSTDACANGYPRLLISAISQLVY